MLACLLAGGCGGCEGDTTGFEGAGDAASRVDTSQDIEPAPDTHDDAEQDTTDASAPDADTTTCPPANACGAACCAEGELCLDDQCVAPGAPCTNNLQCGDQEVCEPTLGACLPDRGDLCEYRPGDQVFDPVVNLAWRDGPDTPSPTYNQVMMTPSVLDIDESGSPDILFSTFTGSSYNAGSVLRAIDGETFEPIFDLTDADRLVAGSASLAAGDIDSDGLNEIVAVQPQSNGIVAFDDHTTGWAVMWRAPGFGMSWDGAYLTDLNADGEVEVVAENRVFNGATGELLCHASGLPANPRNSFAANLDGAGNMEVVSGSGSFLFQSDGSGGFECPNYWIHDGGGGFPAVADFGTFDNGQRIFGARDGRPEVATVNTQAAQQVQLRNGQDGTLIWSQTLPIDAHPIFSPAECSSRNGGGPPTIADFDGDGAPEVATAGACFYVVYDTDGTLLWKHPSQDFSSRVTGSSVFDFQGDGKAEVIYADECFIRVYDGAGRGDGTTEVLFKRSHTSGTTRELPVVVDVDADYHAEIVLISNDYSGVASRCSQNWADFDALGGEERGILVIEDAQNRWVATRPVWNQHAYHVTNVCDGVDASLCQGRPNRPGAIPIRRDENWSVDYLNNFRQNIQGDGLFNAPDLQVTNIKTTCEPGNIQLEITIGNVGSRGVRAGVNVAVFITNSGAEQLLTTLQTTRDLPPGGRQTLDYTWASAPDLSGSDVSVRVVADADATGAQQHNECREDNNELLSQASCSCTSTDQCGPGEYCNGRGECQPFGD